MKNKNIIWMLALLVCVSTVLAISVRPHPEIYWGYVYVDSALAADGTTLSVETAGGELLESVVLPVGSATQGGYSLKIQFDNPLSNGSDEGADPDEALVWKIDGVPASVPDNDTAVGGATNNNFTIEGVSRPYITVVSADYNNSVSFGDVIDVNLTLLNSGSGLGNATISTGSSVPNTLPSTLTINESEQKTVSFDFMPSACGSYSETVNISYDDVSGSYAGTTLQGISFDSLGADLTISQISLLDNVSIGDTLEIRATVSNNGTENTSLFNTTLFIDGDSYETRSSNYTLADGDNLTLVFSWTVGSGSHTFRAVVENLDAAECDTSNDQDDVAEAWGSSGGGSSGGGSSGGGSSSSGTTDTSGGEHNISDDTSVLPAPEPQGPEIIYDYEPEEEKDDNLITGSAVSDSWDLRLDFMSLLVAFIIFVCLTSTMMMYRGRIVFEQKPRNDSVLISDNKNAKNYSMIPFAQLNDQLKIVDSITGTKMSYEDIMKRFKQKGHSKMMIDLAVKAVRNNSVVMTSQQNLLDKLKELNIRRNSDYVSYAGFVKATKLIADLYKTQKEGQDMRKEVEDILNG